MTDLQVLTEIGIDTEEGLAYCAEDPEFYEEMLCEYVTEGQENVEELKRFFENEDWKNYGIKAHSVKSTSRMIGAKQLAERALEMETAAKIGDDSVILSGHSKFLKEYDALLSSLQKAFG